MNLTQEQRAALEWAINEAFCSQRRDPFTGSRERIATHQAALQALLDGDCGGVARDAEREPDGKGSGVPVDSEKGGEPRMSGSETWHLTTEKTEPLCQSSEPSAGGVLRPPPPDSPAKIAAEMRAKADDAAHLGGSVHPHNVAENLYQFAARVEALGQFKSEGVGLIIHDEPLPLEPVERETVGEVLKGIRSLYWTKRHFGYTAIEATIDRKEADRWIAALAPIAEKGAGT